MDTFNNIDEVVWLYDFHSHKLKVHGSCLVCNGVHTARSKSHKQHQQKLKHYENITQNCINGILKHIDCFFSLKW